MKQFTAGKDTVAYAAKIGGGVIADAFELNELADGAVVVVDSAGNLVLAATLPANIADGDFIIAVGSGNATTGAFTTKPIKRSANEIKQAYVAPVLQRTFVGNDGSSGDLNLPATLNVGDAIRLSVIDTNQSTNVRTPKERFEVVVRSGSTATSIITEIIAQINARSQYVTATVVGAQVGIQLDAIEARQTFEVTVDGIMADADIFKNGAGSSVAIVMGSGTAEQMAEVEDALRVVEGDTSRIHLRELYFSVPSQIVAGETYDVYNYTWDYDKAQSYRKDLATTTQYLTLALPNGATQQADFETVMGNVII